MTFGSNFRPGGAVREIRDAARAYGEYRRTVRELGMLSDRDLSDLGLRRSDIRAVARDGSFWG